MNNKNIEKINMQRLEIDHTEQNITYIFCFYKKYETNKRIIIAALSYIEARNFLIEFNHYAEDIYGLTEYRSYKIDSKILYDICNVDKDYEGYPIFISEEKFKELKKYILNFTFANLNRTKTLTTNVLNKIKNKLIKEKI